jgi:hypothetical protein
VTIIATAELAAFALEFSFSRPATRETLYIEAFFLAQQVFIAAVGGKKAHNACARSIIVDCFL